MSKILKCKKCGDIIQSKHRHDMVWCKCHSIAIDGGDDYFRWAGNKDDIEVYVPESEKDEAVRKIREEFDLFTIRNAFKYQNVIEQDKMTFAINFAIEELDYLYKTIYNNSSLSREEIMYVILDSIRNLKEKMIND